MLINICLMVGGLAAAAGTFLYLVAEDGPLYWDDWTLGAVIHKSLTVATGVAGFVTFLRGIGVV